VLSNQGTLVAVASTTLNQTSMMPSAANNIVRCGKQVTASMQSRQSGGRRGQPPVNHPRFFLDAQHDYLVVRVR
jgi:hypothetical protein